MGRTTVVPSKNKYVVENRLSNPEAVHERELTAIAGGTYDNILPVIAEKRKKDLVLKCQVDGMISLKSYFNRVMSKKMFLGVIRQIAAVVKECERNLMNIQNLMLDPEAIFLDPGTKKVKCIFWPIVNNQRQSVPAEFFRELPYQVVFSKHENHDYVMDYLQYFKNHTPFSITGFEKMVAEMAGQAAIVKSHEPSGATGNENHDLISTVLQQTKGITGNIAYNPLGRKNEDLEKNVCANCGHPFPADARFCAACGSPVNRDTVQALDISEVLRITDAPDNSGTVVLGAVEGFGTTVLGTDGWEEPAFPYLVRVKTEEKISVNKPVFRFGKERNYCDYFVADNNAVSRSHADIITRDGRYYVIDNNSTNKTYVDNRAIPVQKEIEIFSGTKLRLANEDFVFYS